MFEEEKKIDEEIKNNVTIYTDGACSGNPGAGGWGAVLIYGDKIKEISGFDPLTTNNKMELLAVIKALSILKQRCNVELYSDSAYVVNAINLGWLNNWKKNGYKGSDKKTVKNIELWTELDSLLAYHKVTFIKVKGHADNELNNRCDELATSEIARNVNNQI
ncbi:MAG: ribonuclease HI [Clostridia bacterium]|nr:ribonuclease HI [Clostridia bacterium]